MDAKVLRAAVAAALRVTVSTTLIGCGGNVTTDAARSAAPAVQGTPANTGDAQANDAGAATSPPYPTSSASAAGSAAATPTATAGMPNGGAETDSVASGGAAMGGLTSLSGAAGGEAFAGAPGLSCDAAAEACLTTLEQTLQQPVTAATTACCDTVIATLDQLRPADAVCYDSINTRFLRGGARTGCCADPSTWVHQACAPWGPPVPPELTQDALLAWSLAA